MHMGSVKQNGKNLLDIPGFCLAGHIYAKINAGIHLSQLYEYSHKNNAISMTTDH